MQKETQVADEEKKQKRTKGKRKLQQKGVHNGLGPTSARDD